MKLLKILWVLPVTLWAMPFVWLNLLGGGMARVRRGCLETSGPVSAAFLRRLPIGPLGAAALTAGHIVLGRDPRTLDLCRDHELVHVRQFERFGIFLPPCYFLAMAWLALTGRDGYQDNPFEREARDSSGF
jgi:hypothetical protein